MGFEALFVTNRSHLPTGGVVEEHGKGGTTGSEGAFGLVMSMALAAMNSGGTQIAGGGLEDCAAGIAGTGVEDSAVSSVLVETQMPPGDTMASAEAVHLPETGWTFTEDISPPSPARMAGPVEAAAAAETGGQSEVTAELDRLVTGAPIPPGPSHTHDYTQPGAAASLGRAFTGVGALTSATATREAAEAPVYGHPSDTIATSTGAAITRIAVEGSFQAQPEPVASGHGLPLLDGGSRTGPAFEASLPDQASANATAQTAGNHGQAVNSAVSPVGAGLATTEGIDSVREGRNFAASSNPGAERVETLEEDMGFEDLEPVAAEEPGAAALPAVDGVEAALRAIESSAKPEAAASAADVDSPSDGNPIRNAREIAETLLRESLKKLPRSVEIRLDPPQLGSVTALLSQRGQDVTVKLVARSSDAQRALENATEDLARALSEKGLTLAGFSVDPGYSGEKGREHRPSSERTSASRYPRMAMPVGVAGIQASGQPVGAFSWLA